jgi:hypothetical protein
LVLIAVLNDEEFFDALEIGLDQLEAASQASRAKAEQLAQQQTLLRSLPETREHRFSSFVQEQVAQGSHGGRSAGVRVHSHPLCTRLRMAFGWQMKAPMPSGPL